MRAGFLFGVLHYPVMAIGGAVSYLFFQLVVPVLFTASLVSFLWGMSLYFIAGGQDDELSGRGKTVMLYGLLSLIVTMVFYGLLSLVRAELG